MAQIEGLYNQNDEQFAGISNLMSAVSNNDVEGTRFFAKAGSIIVNQKNKGGATALHIASREGNLDIVKILIDSGANPNIADNEGYTPLMRASLSASAEVVEYLLKNGAKPGIFNSQNETAIIHATNAKCDDCINALIENGQIIKSVDTLLLKAQIADAIVVANNQDNEKTKAILHGFLDYV
ncbi:MAG: ankyrin repeat domain-containing protein, partial [Alphaproteobacteria bacterium]